MKRVLIVFLLLAACKRSEEQRRSRPSPPPEPPKGQARVPVLHPEISKPRVSTPAKCAGDGSYEQAVECFRMSSGFRFHVASPAINGNGELRRPRIGQEQMTVGDWSAESKVGGIVWTRGGKPATPSPELERLYQRLTIYLDPQKKEGSPQLADSSGNKNHYRFTDANSGEPYDVYIAKDDGRIVELRAGKTDISIQ